MLNEFATDVVEHLSGAISGRLRNQSAPGIGHLVGFLGGATLIGALELFSRDFNQCS
jgi:hypothetical protein